MHPVLKLVRFGNTVVSFIGAVVAGFAAYGHGLAVPIATLAAIGAAGLSTACVTAGGNVLNDLGDVESDRTNHPTRPLVTGAITVVGARRLAIALLVVAAVAIAPFSLALPLLPVFLAVALLVLFAYEFRFKARGLPGNLLVATLTALVFVYGGIAGADVLVVLPLALMALFATFSREVIKDIEDMAGDVDRRTYPQTHGVPAATRLARVSVALALLLSPVPLLLTVPLVSAAGIIYVVLVAAADVLFLVSVAWLPNRVHQEQTVSKGAMAIALAAFLALAFR